MLCLQYLLLALLLASMTIVVNADDNTTTTLVFLPRIDLEMLCSYDIRPPNRPINMTRDLEQFYLAFLPPFTQLRIDGWPDIMGQENVWPPCEYDSSKTLTTAGFSGWGYFEGDNITEEDILHHVTSASLYEFFFRNVCQYEIEMWNVVLNDPTFTLTSDGNLICPCEKETNTTAIIAGSVVGGLVLLGVLIGCVYWYRKRQKTPESPPPEESPRNHKV